MLYLSFITLLPFAAYLLGKYPAVQFSVLVYGFNVLLIAIVSAVRFEYAFWADEIDTGHNSHRSISQARVRMYMTVVTTLLGILASYFSLSLALFLYAFPIIFNIIPGTLNAIERLFGFRLGER